MVFDNPFNNDDEKAADEKAAAAKKRTAARKRKAKKDEKAAEEVVTTEPNDAPQAAGVETVAADEDVEIEQLPGGGTRETPRKSRRYS